LKTVSYHPEAKAEADAAAAFYYQRNPQAAHHFLQILEIVQNEIQEAPHRWPFEPDTTVQRRVLKGFPFKVFYGDEPGGILIVAVAHTSRRPGYWKGRLRN
jgi:toxin ParE1/3/4